MEEIINNVVSLFDENGLEAEFDVLMAFDYEGKRYVALLPMDSVEGIGEDEVLLLEVVRENGEETYRGIENPVLLDEVFEEFIDLFEDQFDEDDED